MKSKTTRKIKPKELHFPVIIEQDEDGIFIISCPVFKGCHSYGASVPEAIENINEVIEMCIEEEKSDNKKTKNKFIGFREVTIKVA